MKYKSVKGMEDILPEESLKWQKIEDVSRDIFSRYGYREIRTPILEEAALFVKSVGEDTDIVKKEMFAFKDRGGRDVVLRPEGTAPIVRAYLEANLHKTSSFQKFYYIGSMFRAERPQAGRFRQFNQIGLEAIGSTLPVLDVDVVLILMRILDSCGMKDYKLKINNLGCRKDKKMLSKVLKEKLSSAATLNLLCEDCRRRLDTNPLRVLDCKNENCKKAIRASFSKIEFLCAGCKKHFNEVLDFLDKLNKKYMIDPYLVRGLDYYTSTVFEVTHPGLGSQDAIAAGGRYDNLVSDMGGPELGAVGFALGIERLMIALEKEGEKISPAANKVVYVATMGEESHKKGFELANNLRVHIKEAAFSMDYENKSLKAQMREANRLSAKIVVIIGEDELSKGEVILRDMQTKEQVGVKFEDVVEKIKEKMK